MAKAEDRYAELHRIARRRGQRGYFTSAQAEAAGISRTRVSRLVDRGLIVRAAAGVYRFRIAAAADWRDKLAAEILSSGGVAGGLSATALYRLTDPPTAPDVVVPRARTGASGRRSTRELPHHERVNVDGLPALSPVRAVIDAAHLLPRARAVAMIESAIVRGLVRPESLLQRAKELTHSKRPGCAVVLSILDELNPDLARACNEWEALVARRAQEFGLPAPRLEHMLTIGERRYFADAAWPEERVALEFDGRDPHMRKVVHDNDSGRRNDFNDAGWLRYGITATALKDRNDRVFAQVARAIVRRRALPGLDLSPM